MNYSTITIPTVIDPNAVAAGFRSFGLAIGFWTLFVGTFGNILTILAFFSNKKLQTTFNVFLLNLAVIDLCSASVMLAFNIAGYIMMEWPFGSDSFTARLQAFNYFCCGYSSIVFLIAITVNRFVAVLFPTKRDLWFSKDRMIWIIVVCNVTAPAILLPSLIGTHETCPGPSHGLTGFSTRLFLCTFVCMPPGWNGYVMFIRVLFQFMPLIIMIVMYSIMFIHLGQKRRHLARGMSTVSGATPSTTNIKKSVLMKGSSTGSMFKNSEMNARRKQEEKRMLHISVVICVGFMLTFLPSVILSLIPGNYFFDVRWHMAASNLAWFNSSMNPIIYVALNRRFRREYWRLLQMAVGRVRGRFVHDSTTQRETTVAVRKQSSSTGGATYSQASRQ